MQRQAVSASPWVSSYPTNHLTGVTFASNEREDDYADSKRFIRLGVKELFDHDTAVNKAVSENDDAKNLQFSDNLRGKVSEASLTRM
jgi:hypothetical protein